jgi:hypothetical protein
MAQKIVQYQAVLQLAQTAPQLYDMAQLHRQMLDVLGVKNAEKLVSLKEDQKPKDPISENMDVLNGQPVKAFIYQDQEAHITAHQTFLQDPQTAAIIGQNPNASQITAAMHAHIAEHFGFKYRQMVEQQMGAPLPKPNEEMPEEYEIQVSRLVAQASQQLLEANKAEAAQQQAQEQQQDPIIQMQQKELAIKEADVQRKQAKDQTDAQLKTSQQQIERERIAAQERQANQALMVKKQIESEKLEAEGTKVGSEIAASRSKLEVDLMKHRDMQTADGIKTAMAAAKKGNK